MVSVGTKKAGLLAMKLLLINHNNRQTQLLQRTFRVVDHEVASIHDRIEAFDSSVASNCDLIILDRDAPEADGIGVCRRLRELGSRIPILMLSDKTEAAERVRGLDAGADDYMTKPFDVSELVARVRALGRRAFRMAAHVRVGSLELDRLEHQVSLNGHAVALTPREFALLTYLVCEAGRVVPRAELLRKVWDVSHEPGSNTVDTHVKKVRSKLGDCANLIETVRGIGYRMSRINLQHSV